MWSETAGAMHGIPLRLNEPVSIHPGGKSAMCLYRSCCNEMTGAKNLAKIALQD
jgi:hypothetical protein